MKKRCLLLAYTDLGSDPRVMKHFEALQQDYDMITAGISPIGKELQFVSIQEQHYWEDLVNRLSATPKGPLVAAALKGINFLRFKVFNRFYHRRYWNKKRKADLRQLKALGHMDLVVCNDLNTLPLGAELAGKGTRIAYDAHEYHAEEHAERSFWVGFNRPLIHYLYRRYLHKADVCITVGENIAKRYGKEYNKPFAVVYNTPPYLALPPGAAVPGKIRLVHSGMYGQNRNIGELIKAMDLLPEQYELHLLITNPNDELRGLIAASAAKSRITLHPPVKLHDVARFINQFDIGVHLMAAVNFNNDNALPNKYFQYIQARVVTAFGPLSEIKLFTRQHDTGVICEGYTGQDLANALGKLTAEEISRIKSNNNLTAQQFCDEREVEKLRNLYKHLMA